MEVRRKSGFNVLAATQGVFQRAHGEPAEERRVSGHYPERIKLLPSYDGRFDAYRLEARGAEVLFASYPAGTEIPPHTHATDNHGVITRGELILSMEGTVSRFAVGDWYHVPANVLHSARFEVETDEVEFWFHSGNSRAV